MSVLGVSQHQIAPLVGRSQQSLSRMVNGQEPDTLVIEKLHWLMAKHQALTTIEVENPRKIAWCKKSDNMDPPAFLEHLPWCAACQAATLKTAGYVG